MGRIAQPDSRLSARVDVPSRSTVQITSGAQSTNSLSLARNVLRGGREDELRESPLYVSYAPARRERVEQEHDLSRRAPLGGCEGEPVDGESRGDAADWFEHERLTSESGAPAFTASDLSGDIEGMHR
jgi:hypothetical protein